MRFFADRRHRVQDIIISLKYVLNYSYEAAEDTQPKLCVRVSLALFLLILAFAGTTFADLGEAVADVLCQALLCGWGCGDHAAEFSLIPL